jgi:hypothetical protein
MIDDPWNQCPGAMQNLYNYNQFNLLPSSWDSKFLFVYSYMKATYKSCQTLRFSISSLLHLNFNKNCIMILSKFLIKFIKTHFFLVLIYLFLYCGLCCNSLSLKTDFFFEFFENFPHIGYLYDIFSESLYIYEYVTFTSMVNAILAVTWL